MYKIWECVVCGWVYNEAKGDAESGLAPGTKWEDIDDSWECPDCGMSKEDFDMIQVLEDDVQVEAAESSMVEASQEVAPIVVLGTGMAGYTLVRELRKHDQQQPVILISRDDGRSYSKPMLSTGFTKGQEADDLVQFDAGTMGRQLNASVWTMTEVTAIDTDKQQIHLAHGAGAIHYGKLVLALGSSTTALRLSGDAQDQIYAINDLNDFARFRASVKDKQAKRICVIGGGLIGCEFANDLLNGGYEVDVVDPLDTCLPGLLPEVAGKAVQTALEALGGRFHFGAKVTSVSQGLSSPLKVYLDNGTAIGADIVISAIGIRARTELAEKAGIKVNRGIVTDRLLQTSAKNVYALGDCAEVDSHVLAYVAPLLACAKALGKTLAGEPTEVTYSAMPIVVKTPACPTVVNPVAKDAEGQWSVECDGINVTAQFHDANGVLKGFALTGNAVRKKAELQQSLAPLLS